MPDPNCPVCDGTGRYDDDDRWVPCACLGELNYLKKKETNE